MTNRIMRVSARFLLPLGLVIAAATLRSVLIPILRYAPYITFFPAITISALYGGLGPGIFAIALSVIVVAPFFNSGISAFDLIPGGLAGMIVFLASAVIIVGVCAQLRHAQKRLTEEARRLRESELTLEAEIAERKRTEEERERLIADLERSNRELEQFANIASHDLQEPLRMIGSYVQLLERKYKGKLDAQADKYIGYSVDGAIRMQKLIEGLLAFSRIGTHGADFRPVHMNRVFESAVSNLMVAIRESRAVITRDDLPVVSGDETQLTQLVQNLVGNAIKFRKHGTPPAVRLSAEKSAREWVFSIADNGIGMKPDYFDRIFRIFQRLHSREEYPGTGIGLALCKRIVERHHGRIRVESKPGEGTTFFFTIPLENRR